MKLVDYVSVLNNTRYLTVAFPYHPMDDIPDFAAMHAALTHESRVHSPLKQVHAPYQFSQLQSVAEEFGYRHKLHEHVETPHFKPFWNPVGYWLHLMTELPKIHTLDILTEHQDHAMYEMMQSFMDFIHDYAKGPRIRVRLHSYPWNLDAWSSDENLYNRLEHHDQRLIYTYHAPQNASIFLTAMATLHGSPIAIAEPSARHATEMRHTYWQWRFVQMQR